jgi:hypothetical protein
MTPRLADICEKLDVRVIPTTKYRGPMETCAPQTLERILADHGEGHLIVVLRSIVETAKNQRELVAPVIWAVSDIVLAHPQWPAEGLAWLEAPDACDLSAMRVAAKANRKAAAPRQAIATMLFEKLRTKFNTKRKEA